MAFNFEQWKESIKQNLQGWKGRMEKAGAQSVYYFLGGVSLLPVAQAVHSGDWSGLAVLGASLGTAVSTNLLANMVQKLKDKSDAEVAEILEAEAQSQPEIKAELDALLEKLETLPAATSALSKADKAWFEETIQRELENLGSQIVYSATLIGDGAIAQGKGSKAVGKGGMLVEGDWNGDVIIHPDPAKGEEARIEKAKQHYLETLRRHCQVLPLAALGGEEGANDELSLDDVYIDLDTTLYIKKADLADLRNGKKMKLPQTALGKETPEMLERIEEKKDVAPLPALDAVRATQRVVLLGEPGAGKSTFARKLLGLQAAVLLGECKPVFGFDADLLPILVILREISGALGELSLNGLSADMQKRKLLEVFSRHLDATFLNAAVEEGRVLLVLDGLDEVPQNLRKIVRQLVTILIAEYRLERLVITSRIRSYTGNAIFENIQTFTLRPFDKEKIAGFVRAWYATQTTLGRVREQDREGRVRDLVQAATSNDLREIASNPMLLTSMAIIHQKEVTLPKQRVRLYKLVVDVLLRRWQKHKLGEKQMAPSPALVEFLKDENRLLTAMERLAYETQSAGNGGKNVSDLPRLKALEILEQKEFLGEIGLANEFLDYVDQRSGLMRGNGGELDKPTSYGFPHRTFQEYLAGCYLIRDRSAAREYYHHAAEGDLWTLAAILGAEELYFNRRGQHYMRDLAYELFPGGKLESSADQRAALWSALIAQIAGQIEIEADSQRPKGGKAYLGEIRPALIHVMQSDLPPLERADAGRALSKLGDPRLEVVTCEQMVFCHVPKGEFIYGEGKEQKKINLDEFWIGKYPITNAQFAQFVQAGGYDNKDFWEEAIKEKYWSSDGFKGRLDNAPRKAPVDYGEPFAYSNHPVVGISWYEALAFTRWLNSQLIHISQQWMVIGDEKTFRERLNGRKIHVALPTEQQWEKAARGADGREYPWLGEIDPNKANTSETGIGTTSAVGCFPAGQSPYGVLEASGNVWEWMASPYDKSAYILRGGSFYDAAQIARCAFRLRDLPDLRLRNYGFRIVVSPALLS